MSRTSKTEHDVSASSRGVAGRAQRLLAHAEARRDGRGEQARLAQRCELDQPDAGQRGWRILAPGIGVREQLEARISALKREFEIGERRLRELDQESVQLRETLLRISGAIQVLDELLAEGNGPATARDVTRAGPPS